MRNFRLLIIAVATICVLALGAFAFVSPVQAPGDDIIIKGGSLEIQCKSGNDCLDPSDGHGHYKHKKHDNHITHVQVRDSTGTLYNGTFEKGHQPEIEITFK